MPSAPPGVRQALKALQARIRQSPADEPIAAIYHDTRHNPPVELLLTDGHLAAINAAETAIAADERFEHLALAADPIRQFAADCAADHQADHINAFMARQRRIASTRVCYFGVEFLRVSRATEVAGVRLLPLGDPGNRQSSPEASGRHRGLRATCGSPAL